MSNFSDTLMAFQMPSSQLHTFRELVCPKSSRCFHCDGQLDPTGLAMSCRAIKHLSDNIFICTCSICLNQTKSSTLWPPTDLVAHVQ